MKIKELQEDNWWEHQAKRVGTKVAGSLVPDSLGGAFLKGMALRREKVSELMNEWDFYRAKSGNKPTMENVVPYILQMTGIDKRKGQQALKRAGIPLDFKGTIPRTKLRELFLEVANALGDYGTDDVDFTEPKKDLAIASHFDNMSYIEKLEYLRSVFIDQGMSPEQAQEYALNTLKQGFQRNLS